MRGGPLSIKSSQECSYSTSIDSSLTAASQVASYMSAQVLLLRGMCQAHLVHITDLVSRAGGAAEAAACNAADNLLNAEHLSSFLL